MSELSEALKLSRAKGVGASLFKKLIEQHMLPSAAFSEYLKKVEHEGSSLKTNRKAVDLAQMQRTIDAVDAGEIKGCYYIDQFYPIQLADLGEPPPVLFWKGKLPGRPMAAVVGTRMPDQEALRAAADVSEWLIQQGFAIVSGGADGIDAAAHKAALARNCETVAVLANGLDIVYPAKNRGLFEQIEHCGALLTELMLGARPARSFFPTRNRIIAGLADVVIIVQAGKGSGSLITASWAARLGRKLLVVEPKDSADEKWAGSQMLLKSGVESFKSAVSCDSIAKAPVKLADRIEEFLFCS